MSRKIYYLLSAMMAGLLIAVNLRSHWRFWDVQMFAFGLWLMVELISGIVGDIADIIRMDKEDE